MYSNDKILIGKSNKESIYIEPKMANRHGFIAGATGTGKTITLKVLAESFSDCGVPVFLADIKGDLAATCLSGSESDSVKKRVEELELTDFDFHGYPVQFWDIYQKQGLPLRTTISEMGPLLLSRILGLNNVQSDILTIIFKIADDEGLLLLDTKDLKSMIQYVGDHAQDYTLEYGNITKQSLGAIVRSVVALEAEGGKSFFGEPAVNIADWLNTDENGKGLIQILDCQQLISNPTMYATFMLWLVSELFETLPEAGDLDKPKMVFFFDEAHLLFQNSSKDLLDKIEQTVKLIRSKGVGIYFITQTPSDIPDGVLGQLNNKIQHALRAYTPKEQKALKAIAESLRPNPEFKTYDVLSELGIGEALISVLDEKGVPTIVKKATILPPQSQMGALDDETRDQHNKSNPLYETYIQELDRESAYELLTKKAEDTALKEEYEKEKAEYLKEENAKKQQQLKEQALKQKQLEKQQATRQRQIQKQEAAKQREIKKAVNSATGTLGRELGKTIGKTIGGDFGKRIGGNIGSSLGRGLLNTFIKNK